MGQALGVQPELGLSFDQLSARARAAGPDAVGIVVGHRPDVGGTAQPRHAFNVAIRGDRPFWVDGQLGIHAYTDDYIEREFESFDLILVPARPGRPAPWLLRRHPWCAAAARSRSRRPAPGGEAGHPGAARRR